MRSSFTDDCPIPQVADPHDPAPQPIKGTADPGPVFTWYAADIEPPPVALDEAADEAVIVKVVDVKVVSLNSPVIVKPPTALPPLKVT